MKIIAVSNSITQPYVDFVAKEISDLGYPVSSISLQQCELLYNTTTKTTPAFYVEKHGKLGYLLEGKRSLDEILQWVINSGVICK